MLKHWEKGVPCPDHISSEMRAGKTNSFTFLLKWEQARQTASHFIWNESRQDKQLHILWLCNLTGPYFCGGCSITSPLQSDVRSLKYNYTKRGALQFSGLVLIFNFYLYSYHYPSWATRATPKVNPFHPPGPGLMSIAPHPFTCCLRRLKHTPNHVK